MSKRSIAAQRNPDFNWVEYDQAIHRQAQVARQALVETSRRLDTTDKKVVPLEEKETMSDKALIQTGNAIIQATWGSQEEVEEAVLAVYSGSKQKFSKAELQVVVQVAYSMGLDPNPAMGHIYAWKTGTGQYERFCVALGYQGLAFKAKQQYEYFNNPPREMNREERKAHGLEEGDVGAVCELYEMKAARMARELGMQPQPIIGYAVWKKKSFKNSKTGKWVSDNIPSNRSALWVAQKNALKDALRKLGLGVNSFKVPHIEGYGYDPDSETFTEIGDGPVETEEPNITIIDEEADHWIDSVNWKKFWVNTKALGLNRKQVHAALNVESVKEFTGSEEECWELLHNAAEQNEREGQDIFLKTLIDHIQLKWNEDWLDNHRGLPIWEAIAAIVFEDKDYFTDTIFEPSDALAIIHARLSAMTEQAAIHYTGTRVGIIKEGDALKAKVDFGLTTQVYDIAYLKGKGYKFAAKKAGQLTENIEIHGLLLEDGDVTIEAK